MKKKKTRSSRPIDRRKFLNGAAKSVAAVAGAGILGGCDTSQFHSFFQRHFKELSKQELADILASLEREYSDKFKKKVSVTATPPMEEVLFGYGLDLSRCIGCRRCVYACRDENNLSRDPQIHWIRVLEMEKSKGVNLLHANHYYNPKEVPREDSFYMPIACQQCRHPTCTKVCPVGATWQEPDGIVVIDYDWCIGCRYCMAACPYGARHFNWAEPELKAEDVNPDMEYLGNRPRPKGVVEKCTFCLQRTRKGLYPSCVEVCPVGARKFGNLLDENSEIRKILKNKRVYILKEELDTQPKFYYFFGT